MIDGDVPTFSESKKQFKKTKLLVTYDIFENKKYALLLTLIESMINDKNALKNLRSYVLPIKTPAEKYLEVYKKILEKKKKKHKKGVKEVAEKQSPKLKQKISAI